MIITDFTNAMTEQNDIVDDAIYNMLCEVSGLNPEAETLEWDMEIIGEVADTIESMFKQKGIPFCRPFREADGDKETMCPYCREENGDLVCGYKTCVFKEGE